MSIESIVRPFESGSVTPPTNVPTALSVKIKNAIINPGAGGAAKTMSGAFSFTETFYAVNKANEETQ